MGLLATAALLLVALPSSAAEERRVFAWGEAPWTRTVEGDPCTATAQITFDVDVDSRSAILSATTVLCHTVPWMDTFAGTCAGDVLQLIVCETTSGTESSRVELEPDGEFTYTFDSALQSVRSYGYLSRTDQY